MLVIVALEGRGELLYAFYLSYVLVSGLFKQHILAIANKCGSCVHKGEEVTKQVRCVVTTPYREGFPRSLTPFLLIQRSRFKLQRNYFSAEVPRRRCLYNVWKCAHTTCRKPLEVRWKRGENNDYCKRPFKKPFIYISYILNL